MKNTRKMIIILFTVFSMLFAIPSVAAEKHHSEATATKQYNSVPGSCAPTEGYIYCEFAVDVDKMQHYTDNVIPLDFAIYGIDATEEFTVTISGSIEFECIQFEGQTFSSQNNEVSLDITILESGYIQNVEELDYEYITVSLQNNSGKTVYMFDATVINTQHGLFVSYVNDEVLFIHYLQWLKDNAQISSMEYKRIDIAHHTAESTNISQSDYGVLSEGAHSVEYLEAFTVRIDYTIHTYDDGETLHISGNVFWGGNGNKKLPARYIEIELYDEDLSATYQLLAATNTTETGYFHMYIENATGILENGYDLLIKVKARSPYGNVRSRLETSSNIDTTNYIYVDCGDNIISDRSGYGVSAKNSVFSESIYLLDALVTGAAYVKAMSGETLPCVKITYPHSDIMQNFYLPGAGIQIVEASFSDWDVVLHEYGHFVADNFDFFPFVKMAHDENQNLISYLQIDGSIQTLSSNPKKHGCELAWQEGWANYFSISSQIHQNANILALAGIGDELWHSTSLENNDSTNNRHSKGEGHEMAVARVLWDMADIQGSTRGASDSDPINYGFLAVWNYTTYSKAQTFSDYMQYMYGILNKTSNNYRNIGRILADHRICAEIISISATQISTYITMRPAYSDDYVSNMYYVEIYNPNMQRIFQFSIGAGDYTYEISTGLWNSICSQYTTGFYVAVRTDPNSTSYTTGPYYSSIEYYEP